MTKELTPMRCRSCGSELIPRCTQSGKRAHCFAECFYHCGICGVAYSNSLKETDRTLIFDRWSRNLPGEVHAGLIECMGRSLNKRSQKQKLARLAFETSEDAVTWTVFRYLERQKKIDSMLGTAGARLFFWGAHCPDGESGSDGNVTQTLQKLLADLGENPERLSEPDVLAVAAHQVFAIEVKFLSINSRQRNYKNFGRYLDAEPGIFRDRNAVREAGFYELTRNVVIACRLARALGREQWKVINLGGSRCLKTASEFRELLRKPEHFQFECWADFCRRIQSPVKWFNEYLDKKGLRG